MQALSAPPQESSKFSDKFAEDFGQMLKLNVADEKVEPEVEENENENEEDDFSFVCLNPGGSPISADDAFHNGQIRPIFPIFDQSLLYDNGDGDSDGEVKKNSASSPGTLRKLFFEERSETEEPSGPFCEWSSNNKIVKEASRDACKKSNSTGFSKLWRFRDMAIRSNSDGRDAFVFLNKNDTDSCEYPNKKADKSSTTDKTASDKSKSGKIKGKATGNSKVKKPETLSSAYERHYLKNREMREGHKRKTYSPYSQDLVGFFTNVNGLSKNVHPF